MCAVVARGADTWNRWGRVGEALNKQNSLCGPMPLEQAIHEFKDKFKEKTKNKWEDRASFVVHPKKYTYLERDYND